VELKMLKSKTLNKIPFVVTTIYLLFVALAALFSWVLHGLPRELSAIILEFITMPWIFFLEILIRANNPMLLDNNLVAILSSGVSAIMNAIILYFLLNWSLTIPTSKRIGLYLAIGFFAVWLGILYAGADHPLPRGFLSFILFDCVAAWLIYLRAPTYINWLETHKKYRLFRVLLEGIAIGFVFAAVATIMNPNGGEPSTPPPSLIDRSIWFAVLGVVGSINAILIYFGCFVACRSLKIIQHWQQK